MPHSFPRFNPLFQCEWHVRFEENLDDSSSAFKLILMIRNLKLCAKSGKLLDGMVRPGKRSLLSWMKGAAFIQYNIILFFRGPTFLVASERRRLAHSRYFLNFKQSLKLLSRENPTQLRIVGFISVRLVWFVRNIDGKLLSVKFLFPENLWCWIYKMVRKNNKLGCQLCTLKKKKLSEN